MTKKIVTLKIFEGTPILHGFTTRYLGVDVSQIQALLGMQRPLIQLQQIHSNRVKIFPGDLKEGDALITEEPQAILTIQTADCVPILLFDPANYAIASIHAGWRGIVSGIIENTLDRMKEEFGTRPSDLTAGMGPALCEACFEIGPEVANEFRKYKELSIRKGHEDRLHVDLREVCQQILKGRGVSKIEILPYCTSCNNDLFFSYRRGDRNKRMFSFIGKKITTNSLICR